MAEKKCTHYDRGCSFVVSRRIGYSGVPPLLVPYMNQLRIALFKFSDASSLMKIPYEDTLCRCTLSL